MEGKVHALVIPEFIWINWGKPRKNISLAGFRTEVRYRDLPNMKQVCHPPDRYVGSPTLLVLLQCGTIHFVLVSADCIGCLCICLH